MKVNIDMQALKFCNKTKMPLTCDFSTLELLRKEEKTTIVLFVQPPFKRHIKIFFNRGSSICVHFGK